MNPAFHDLLSGKKHGAFAALTRGALSVAAAGYSLVVRFRNLAYDKRWKKIEWAALPVISIGNLTAGGTGKTPFAAFVARWYRERGVRVCFISRGYGAGEKGTNDEALVLDQLCPDVPHLQNPDRVAAARVAEGELDSQLLILDDGFQHRCLARELDIVLIDATNPWGFGHLHPRGLLREPLSAMKRAGLTVMTRVDQTAPADVEAIRRRIAGLHPDCGIVEATFRPVRLLAGGGSTAPLESLSGLRVAAFCGIGNPDAFRVGLEKFGCQLAAFRIFPDHHNYARADVEELDHWSRSLAVDATVCTQKDLVKIALDRLGDRPLWAIEIGTQVVVGEELLAARLEAVLHSVRDESSGMA